MAYPGTALFDFIMKDIMDDAYKAIVLDNYGVAIAGIFASNWLKKHMEKWLNEKDVVDGLSYNRCPTTSPRSMGTWGLRFWTWRTSSGDIRP